MALLEANDYSSETFSHLRKTCIPCVLEKGNTVLSLWSWEWSIHYNKVGKEGNYLVTVNKTLTQYNHSRSSIVYSVVYSKVFLFF